MNNFNRLKQILLNESRHWYLFSNEYNRETHLAREDKQSVDDWSLKCSNNFLKYFFDFINSILQMISPQTPSPT